MDAVSPNVKAVASTLSPADQRKLRDTANEVESLFLTQMLKTMRQASVVKGGPLTGQGQQMYTDMMDEQLGRTLAKSGGLGLADLLIRDILRRQGVAGKNPSSPPATEPITGPGGLQ
jgi:Rod binding domain-containing protein